MERVSLGFELYLCLDCRLGDIFNDKLKRDSAFTRRHWETYASVAAAAAATVAAGRLFGFFR